MEISNFSSDFETLPIFCNLQSLALFWLEIFVIFYSEIGWDIIGEKIIAEIIIF